MGTFEPPTIDAKEMAHLLALRDWVAWRSAFRVRNLEKGVQSKTFPQAQLGDALNLILLLATLEGRPVTLKQLHSYVHALCTEATVHRHIDAMVENGWVERRQDPEDHRRAFLHPTNAMVPLVLEYLSARSAVLERFGWRFEESDRKTVE